MLQIGVDDFIMSMSGKVGYEKLVIYTRDHDLSRRM